MPQLIIEDFAPQLIWLALIFTLFYLALSNLVLPSVEEVLKARAAKIGGDLQAARDAQAGADKEAELYDAALAEAKSKGAITIRASKEKLDAELAQKRAALDTQLAEKTAETEKRVQTLLAQASGDMEAMTADVVRDIVKSLAGVEVSENEIRAALRQSSKE